MFAVLRMKRIHIYVYIYIYTSRAEQARGGSFKMVKTIRQRKNLPIECAQGDQPVRCPNRVFCVNEPQWQKTKVMLVTLLEVKVRKVQ